MQAKQKQHKKHNTALRYAANLIGMGAGVYLAATALVQLLASLFVKNFHQSATLANPVSVPQAVIMLINILLAAAGILCASWFIYALSGAQLKPVIDLTPPRDKRLWAFLPIFIAVGFIISGLGTALQRFLSENTNYIPPAQAALPSGFFGTVCAILYLCVIPAVLEEFLCRGIMQGILRKWGVWFSIVLSSVVFTLLHSDIVQMPGVFVLSVLLGLAYYATGSLSVCIALHFANNFVVFIFMSVEQKLSGAAMVGFSFYIVLLVAICAAVCIGYIIKIKLLKTLKPIPRVYDAKNRQSRTYTLAASPFFMAIMILLSVRAFLPLFLKR